MASEMEIGGLGYGAEKIKAGDDTLNVKERKINRFYKIKTPQCWGF